MDCGHFLNIRKWGGNPIGMSFWGGDKTQQSYLIQQKLVIKTITKYLSLLSNYMGDHIETVGTVSNLGLVCQTKLSLDKRFKVIHKTPVLTEVVISLLCIWVTT